MPISWDTVTLALVTIITAIPAACLKVLWDKRKYKTLASTREEAVSTVWTGEHSYQTGVFASRMKNPIPIKLSLKNNGRRVTGTAHYKKNDTETKLLLSGGFFNDKLLRLEYTNSQKHQLHFGFFLLELNGEGNKLEGAIIGYGRSPDKIFTATIELSSIH